MLTIIWDEQGDGNAAHIADSFLTFEDVENVLEHPFEETISRSSGRPIRIGVNMAGELTAVVFEWVDDFTVNPIIAFRIRKD